MIEGRIGSEFLETFEEAMLSKVCVFSHDVLGIVRRVFGKKIMQGYRCKMLGLVAKELNRVKVNEHATVIPFDTFMKEFVPTLFHCIGKFRGNQGIVNTCASTGAGMELREL
jgi:hypothetical protein